MCAQRVKRMTSSPLCRQDQLCTALWCRRAVPVLSAWGHLLTRTLLLMLLCLSVSVAVLYSDSEVIGSLVTVCLCVGSVSYLKCFIVPVSQWTAVVHWELWIHLGRSQCFLAVALCLFKCCLMIQMLTSWVFIALCGSVVYCFHLRWSCCLPVCLLSLCWNTWFRKLTLSEMLVNAVNCCNQKVAWRIMLLWVCFCCVVVCHWERPCLCLGVYALHY